MSTNPVTVTSVAEKTQRSLVRKLSEVMAAVGYLQKRGENTAQKYWYAKEADVVEAMRGELAKRQVFIFPSVISCTRTKVERPNFKPELPNRVSYATDLVMRWTFVDGESGERMECDIPGCSESPGDKGVYVAMTGSEKYLLMKSFLIPTGDDPESDENEPRGTKADAQAVADEKLAKFKEREQAQLEREKAQEKKPALSPERVYSDESPRRPIPQMAAITKIAEKQKKDKSGSFWIVTWGGVDYTTFDAKIAEHLNKAKFRGEEAALYTSEKENPNRPGQPYRNLDGIHRIHNQFFAEDGKTPEKDVNQDLMDADQYPDADEESVGIK